MTRYPAKEGQPTATKVSGAEWYYPALTTAFGRPERIAGCDRYETRGKAIAKAKRVLKAKEPDQ